MSKDNLFEVEYLYDEHADILGIKVKRDYEYFETVELDEGLLLDFDKHNIPVALEIIDASKLLNVPKDSLKNLIFFNMKVVVDVKSISINAIFGVLIQDRENKQILESFTSNYCHFPNMETNLVTV